MPLRWWIVAALAIVLGTAAWTTVFAQRASTAPPAASKTATPAEPELDRLLGEQVIRVPITVKLATGRSHTSNFVLTVFKPPGPGPFPVVVVNHGRDGLPQLRAQFKRNRLMRHYFVHRGFVVLAPTRIGYGPSGTDVDPEQPTARNETCQTRTFAGVVENVAAHIAASLQWAATQSYVDPERVVLAGGSAGSFGAIVAAGQKPRGVRAVINFAGGMGGATDTLPGAPCGFSDIEMRMSDAGRRNPLPTIWIYAENDRLWGPLAPRSWHESYVKAGGRAEFHMLPPIGEDGHDIIGPGADKWRPLVDRFLAAEGYEPRKPPPGSPPPSRFARLEDVARVPLINDKGRVGYRAFLGHEIPRAFAIGPGGEWVAIGGKLTAVADAAARCQQIANAPCKLYAVNDVVVWRP